MSASELQQAMLSKYRDARTYSDEGVVHQKLLTSHGFAMDLPFQTAWERGGRFRWEYRSSEKLLSRSDQKYVVWSKDQRGGESWWDVNERHETFSDMEMAMAGPTGVSGGSATAVVPMLLKGTRGMLWVSSPRDAGTEVVDGVVCRKIEGVTEYSNGSIILWIDDALLLRRAFTREVIDPAKLPGAMGGEKFTAETTIDFKPRMDEKILDAAFAPPEMKPRQKQ